MPIEQVAGTDLSYHLISYDSEGRERADDPDGLMSERVVQAIRDTPITDVFVMSHGWKGDVPAAKEQYGRWIAAMASCADDRAHIRAVRPAFRPLIVGFHWPSQPWGDEEFDPAAASFGVAGAAVPGVTTVEAAIDALIDRYAERIADTPRARAALRTIFEAAARGPALLGALPPEVAAAYGVLNEEAGLGSAGEAAAPGDDRERFDANAAYQNANAAAPLLAPPGAGPVAPGAVAFGGFGLSGLLSPLRQLSFWKMKDRARKLGESAGFGLITAIERAAPPERGLRVHLMGHSFGCIVVSGMLNGPDGTGVLPAPVQSLTLVQGALSLWSYCERISHAGDKPGYFHSVVRQRKVAGPIITTRSTRDTAVGRFYPIAAGVALQVAFAPGQLPRYGGVGAFGLQGPGLTPTDVRLEPVKHDYGLRPGGLYNFECSHVIKDGTGPSGAHSDIAKPEVAHAMWQAVTA